MIEAGLKGITATLFIMVGILVTGTVGSLIISIGANSFDSLLSALGMLSAYVALQGLGGLLADAAGTIAFVDAVFLFIVIGLVAPLIGSASALTWYVVLDRLPHWTKDFHYEREAKASDARPLSRRLLASYLVASAVIPVAIAVVGPMVPAETVTGGLHLLAALLILLGLEIIAMVAIDVSIALSDSGGSGINAEVVASVQQ